VRRRRIVVKGVVQGVGFRPFIYKTAVEKGLKGWVNNTSAGVFIEVEGELVKIESFMKNLKSSSLPLLHIESLEWEDMIVKGEEKGFEIVKSEAHDTPLTLISPDVATCPQCAAEITRDWDRRNSYPFTNCTNCGPRFSIIKELPYDRPMTTMSEFKMCPSCQKEYEDPMNRRFHAQPNACPDCGPELWLSDPDGKMIESKDPVNEVVELLKKGKIIAIKGLGGFHLACNGFSEDHINELRSRKNRPFKPFALMMRDVETVKEYCEVQEAEEALLSGPKAPIVLLRPGKKIMPSSIAPGNKRIGVMLPYTPLHHLLFQKGIKVLVMTSANSSGLPMIYKNEDVFKELDGIADFYLFHNRDIHVPVDDSVTVVVENEERIIRRARGYAPLPLDLGWVGDGFAYGPHLKNTFAFSKGGKVFISQHQGDMGNYEHIEHYRKNRNHFKKIFKFDPKFSAADLHPDIPISEMARKEDSGLYEIQHHHAHIASCMAENGLRKRDKVIGLAFDGTGYGTDGKMWGGEVLICSYENFDRVGHLNYIALPGGEAAVKEPWRSALSYLRESFTEDIPDELIEVDPMKKKVVLQMLKTGLNSPKTSSMGRFFDGISALLGIKYTSTYEGEPAIALESVAIPVDGEYSFELVLTEGKWVIDTKNTVREIVKDIKNKKNIGEIAGKFHNTVISFSLKLCIMFREKRDINKVALSGGVFQNEYLLEGLCRKLLEKGFEVYTHKKVPCNDGGISLGQLAVAGARKEIEDVCSSTS